MMFRLGVLLLVLALLAGCSSRPAPVYDRSSNPYRRAAESTTRIERPSYYTVRRGDTLYSIAWRYGIDFKRLAGWNGIAAPYLIYPDQRLRLTEPRRKPSEPSPVEARPVARQPEDSEPKPVPEPAGAAVPATTVKPVARSGPESGSTATPVEVKPSPKPPRKPVATGAPNWQWPADGALLSSFAANDPARKGIDIAGELGQPVRAAAAGEVVYSGVGLRGYGELVIIKHDEDFLSAYGHNRKRLVSEGDRVKAGQTIAEMGRSGTDRPMLHFEIRRNGTPVNPQKYLPER